MAKSNHYTRLAIRSIILGARIADAAVLCDKNYRQMRESLHSFCRKSNPDTYNLMLIDATNDGYNSIRTSDLRARALDFIPLVDLYPNFMGESLDEMADVSNYLEKCFISASASFSICRARRDSWNGLMAIVDSH